MLGYFGRHRSKYRLTGPRVYIRPACKWDQKQWMLLRVKSKDFLTPWEPSWGVDAASKWAFKRRLKRQQLEWHEGRAHGFYIFDIESNQLLGGITLANIRYGVVQGANVGYWIGEPFARQGYMAEAIQLALEFAFQNLNLHRIEAACLAHNDASRQLLVKSGFQEEGLAREYLNINGRWQDHISYAILRTDPRPAIPIMPG